MSANCPIIEEPTIEEPAQSVGAAPSNGTNHPAHRGTVIHFCLSPDGGVWTHIRLLSQQLRPQWRTAVVAVSRGATRPEVLREAKECCDRALILSRPPLFGIYYLAPVHVRRVLEELQIDASREQIVYHFHTGPSTPWFFRIPRHLKGCKLVTYHGSLGNFRDTGVKGFPRRLFGIAGTWRMRKAGFELIAVSRRSAQDCAAMYCVPESTFNVAYSGVVGAERPRLPRSVDDSRPFHIGFLGTVQPGKGWERVVEAAQLVRDSGKNIACTIAGDGHDFPQLKQIAAQRASWLRAPGRIHDATRSFLPTLDVLVLPSDFEGLPLVLPEAMSCGVPCICTDVGGCAEAVRDGKEGFVLRKNCPGEIARDISRLIDDPALWHEFSRNGRKRYEEIFTPQGMVASLEHLYQEAAVP
jgi:glycosyltransferase involved in cell wall biosynthesis